MNRVGRLLTLGLLAATLAAPAAHAAFPGLNGKLLVEDSAPSSESRGIYTLEPDGTGRTQLTSDFRDDQPAWSPDGERIAFATSAFFPFDYEIWLMDADGST